MIELEGTTRNLLLISSSNVHGQGYLDHVESDIRSLLGNIKNVLFIPFALYDRDTYAAKVRERLARMGFTVDSLHLSPHPKRSVEEAQAIFIGGGNTFRLLKALYDFDLLAVIRQRIDEGSPFIGSSAGSIVACPTLKTTKDMPVVEPRSFDALHLVNFQISPHYLDPDPTSTHMGETQEERIMQYLEENDRPVVGLREGTLLRVYGGTVVLQGNRTARIFRRGEQPIEAAPGVNLSLTVGSAT